MHAAARRAALLAGSRLASPFSWSVRVWGCTATRNVSQLQARRLEQIPAMLPRKLTCSFGPLLPTAAFASSAGKDFAEQIPRNAAIQAYVDRCRELADSQPLLLLAHAFTQAG